MSLFHMHEQGEFCALLILSVSHCFCLICEILWSYVVWIHCYWATVIVSIPWIWNKAIMVCIKLKPVLLMLRLFQANRIFSNIESVTDKWWSEVSLCIQSLNATRMDWISKLSRLFCLAVLLTPSDCPHLVVLNNWWSDDPLCHHLQYIHSFLSTSCPCNTVPIYSQPVLILHLFCVSVCTSIVTRPNVLARIMKYLVI